MCQAKAAGFTLVELLVTIAILGLLLTLGLPSFQEAIRSNRMATASNELMAAIALARTEALRSTRGGGFCGANAAGNGCVASGTWTNGVLVWTDATATQGFDAGDVLVRRLGVANDVNVTIGAGTGPRPYQVEFNRMGMVSGTAGANRAITMQPAGCPSGRNLRRILTLTTVGQVRLSKGNCA